jgi:hypothetical protein
VQSKQWDSDRGMQKHCFLFSLSRLIVPCWALSFVKGGQSRTPLRRNVGWKLRLLSSPLSCACLPYSRCVRGHGSDWGRTSLLRSLDCLKKKSPCLILHRQWLEKPESEEKQSDTREQVNEWV